MIRKLPGYPPHMKQVTGFEPKAARGLSHERRKDTLYSLAFFHFIAYHNLASSKEIHKESSSFSSL
jgi:hypothetical protein